MQHLRGSHDQANQAILQASSVALPTGTYRTSFKRPFDCLLVVLTLPLTLPLIVIFWALVRLDGGPGFFAHARIGKTGRPFKCWKLRTMHPHAEDRLKELLRTDPAAAKEWADRQKLSRDPRITKLGAFLRKFSIDELPQIWNVLRGEMSIVGPRPVTAAELPRYGSSAWAYLSLLPGLTGPWQVAGRNSVGYEDRVALDVEYRRKVSFLRDVKIILRTFRAVLSRSGC
jgi:lipopolysaccharide/colanic/teichoic acid biosynthesis glycosyltransferase